MYSGLQFAYWLTLHGFVTLVSVLLYTISSHVRQQRRHPTAAIAWVLFILLMPYLALPAFLTFGSRKLPRPRGRPTLQLPVAEADESGTGVPWPVRTALSLGQAPPASYDSLQLHADGHAALEALWQTIAGARHSIDLCTFIIGRDAIGLELIERLCAKARTGVRVRVLLDGLGSLMRSRPNLRPLRAAGAQFRLFVPPLHSPLKGRTNLRNHRKMLVADATHETRRLWCGGRNLACEYFEGSSGEPPWLDLTFDLRGLAAAQAADLFEQDWSFANGIASVVPPPERLDTAAAAASAETAQLIASGPDQTDDTVYAMLVAAAYRARRRIQLATPYFVPDAALLMALCMAARRGVKVDLLLPARSNHPLSDMARRRALRALAAAGGRIWLAPGMMHAKLAVFDEVLALCGSANLDSRSLFLNYELMMAFGDPAAVARFAEWFTGEQARSSAYVPDRPGFSGDVADGLVLWLGFQL
jgi:cardiolipin synthase